MQYIQSVKPNNLLSFFLFFFLFLYEMLECLVGRIFTHNSEFLSGDNIHVTNVFSRSKLPAPPSLFLVSSAQVQTYEQLLFHRTPDTKRPNRQHRPHRWAFERMQALTQSRKERTQAQSILESPRAVATTTRTDVTHRCYHHAPPLFSCQRGSSQRSRLKPNVLRRQNFLTLELFRWRRWRVATAR